MSNEWHLGSKQGAVFPEEGMLELEQGSDLDRIGWGLGVEETASSGEGAHGPGQE